MKRVNVVLILMAMMAFTQCNMPANETVSDETILTDSFQNQINNTKQEMKPFCQGTIKETIDAGGYTYLLIEENLEGHVHKEGHEHKEFWIAVEKTPAKVGDVVRFRKELVTEHFYSKILDRTFDELMFASNLQYKVE